MPSSLGHLRTFSERPHMSMERFFAQEVQKRSGMRMCGAMRELVRAEQRVALITLI